MRVFFKRVTHIKAPDFPPRLPWLNGGRQSLKSLKGEVVLLYFWTFSSAHCLRAVSVIRALSEKYKDKQVKFIGVHTGEFAFERQVDHVEVALKREGIYHPTIVDSAYKVWNLYANRWWPRIYIIDHNGYLVFDHIGEGGYVEIEMALQKALIGAGEEDLPYIEDTSRIAGGTIYRTSPELYFGYLRGYFGNEARVLPGEEQAFSVPDRLDSDLLYLKGHWLLEKDCVVHDRALSGMHDGVLVRYHGFTVDVVMERRERLIPLVVVTLDGRPIPEDLRGSDIIVKDGHTVCEVREARPYQLISSRIYHGGTLELKTQSKGLALYTMNFGAHPGRI